MNGNKGGAMKPIKISDAQKTLLLNDFKKFLDKLRSNEDKIKYDIKIDNILEQQIEKPTVFFTKLAKDKMVYLVDKCDKEIAWHGLVTYDKAEKHLCYRRYYSVPTNSYCNNRNYR